MTKHHPFFYVRRFRCLSAIMVACQMQISVARLCIGAELCLVKTVEISKFRRARRILCLTFSLVLSCNSSICFCFTWLFSTLLFLPRWVDRPCGGSARGGLRPGCPHLLGADRAKGRASRGTGASQAHLDKRPFVPVQRTRADFVAAARESGH